jgi:asparagine synthase (glutamine-hydrolysing)
MCGIAGFSGKGDESDLRRMIGTIAYRGPDYQGVSHRGDAGLAHARLKIIDLSLEANQPFFSGDGSAAIVFNGEIYNYHELKQGLLKTGKYKFRTSCDTEVLLCLYLEYGTAMFSMLSGMFAFGIYDFRSKGLLLAKDPAGKKPLYYSLAGGTLVFASELKAVIAHPSVSKELNPDALNEYLTYDYVPTPSTIFKNIYKLEASHYLIFRDGKIMEYKPYWKLNYGRPHSVDGLSPDTAAEKLGGLLDAAVRRRLMSDVPLGVFLSGGIDSSAVAWYAQKNSASPVKTFSIGFSEKSYDESDIARLVASHIGTEHHQEILSAQHSLELIPEIIPKLDEPFADPSIIPTYFLSKITRTHVTVALGGDGSDELLAGYPTFISNRFLNLFSAVPKPLMRLLGHCGNMLPASDKNISFDFKVRQFLKGFESDKNDVHTLWLGSFTPAMKQQLFTSGALARITNDNGLQRIAEYLKEAGDAGSFEKILYVYFRTYLQDDILVKVDRSGMYNSLEIRAPFLDRTVVEFINSLPASYKIRGFTVKYLLKKLMRDKLPAQVTERAKKGFGIPVSLWLRNELKGTMEQYLREDKIKKQGLFNYFYIENLKKEHLSGKRNHRKLLWNLMIFEMWCENYLKGS